MKVTARLSLGCVDVRTADALEQVLAPDNVGIPRDQRFTVSREGNVLLFRCVSDEAASVFSTLNSVLKDSSLFQEVWLLSLEREAGIGRSSRRA